MVQQMQHLLRCSTTRTLGSPPLGLDCGRLTDSCAGSCPSSFVMTVGTSCVDLLAAFSGLGGLLSLMGREDFGE